MAKRFGLIALPLQIVKQEQFAQKIQASNQTVVQSTQFSKRFVQRIYDICSRCAKDIKKWITQTQNNLKTRKRQQECFNKFLTDVFEIFQCMQSQISRVIILLKNNKKYQIIKKLNQVINQKLTKAGENVALFANMVKDYNALDEKYVEKAKYFLDIQKNPLKYYSITKNSQKYDKIKKIQDELQERLQAVITIKGEIRVMMNELSNKIKDLYENFIRKIDQVRKSSQVVLLKIIQLIKGFHNIPQVSERAQQESQGMVEKQAQRQSSISRRRQNLTFRQEIRQIKRQKIAQFQRQSKFKAVLLDFISSFLEIIKSAIKQINQFTNQKQYRQFDTQKKKLIAQLLPLRSLQDIDIINQAEKALLNIFIGIQTIMRKELFEQIFKYQKLKYTSFIEQVQQIQDEDIDKLSSDIQFKLFSKIKQKEKRYCQQESIWKRQLDDKYKDIIARIRLQFLIKGNIKVQEKASKQSQLFSQKHFQILTHSYFQNNKAIASFVRSDTIIAYEKIMKSNRIKNILQQIQMGNNIQNNNANAQNKKQGKKQFRRIKSSCCCFSIKAKKKSQQVNLVNKIKESKQIDHYSCALKNGYMLYQGRMTIYQDYLGFKSSFNPSTFFGSTDIFIPKFQIYEFIKGRHIMSEMITVVTKRGSIQFTSFFVDPFDVLNQVYKPNRNTQNQIITYQQLEYNEQQKSQLQILKQKMETQFIKMVTKNQFIINNVKSNLDQKQKILKIFYQYTDGLSNSNKKIDGGIKQYYFNQMTFSVIIKYYEKSLEYLFQHGNYQTLERKKKLQMIAKNIIDQDRVQKFDNFAKNLKERQKQSMDDNISFNMGEQFSIIGTKEKHRLDFGQFQMMPLAFPAIDTPLSNRKNHSQDLHRLLQQNETKIHDNLKASPREYTKILQNLQTSPTKVTNQAKIIKIRNNQQPIPKAQEKKQIFNKKIKKQQNSITVSQNASTVKYGQRQSRLKNNNQTQRFQNSSKINKSIQKQIQQQGMKNLLLMAAIALGLIFIIKLFL